MLFKNKIDKKSSLLIGAPAQPPQAAMVKAITDLLPHHPEVREAYLFMKGTISEEPVLTLGVYFNSNTSAIHHEVFSSIAIIIQSYLSEQEIVDMMPLNGNIYKSVKDVDNGLIYTT